MVSREVEFAIGGTLILAGLIPLEIAIIGNIPSLNLGLLVNFGGIGIAMGFIGFFLVGLALFQRE
ncbi:MAG: hypothetical protein PVJ05_02345 [Candidatus Thorarchaeota archaeon]|jgi:hypothetical protein